MHPVVSAIQTGDLFNGTVPTCRDVAKSLCLPVEGASEQGPFFLIYDGAADIGCDGETCGESQRDAVGIKLPDPSLPNPIYASLFPADEPNAYTPLWSPPKIT